MAKNLNRYFPLNLSALRMRLVKFTFYFLVCFVFASSSYAQITITPTKASDNSIITSSNPLCLGEAVRYEYHTPQNNVVRINGNVPNFTPVLIGYRWVDPNTHLYNLTGRIYIPMNIVYADGTMLNTTCDIYIYGPPTADFSAFHACLQGVIRFTDHSASASPSPVNQWQWDFGDGSTSNVQNPSHTYALPGNYQVKLRVSDQFNCSSAVKTEQVNVDLLPVADFNFPTQLCAGEPITFINNSTTVAGTTYTWDFSGLGTSNTFSPTVTFKNAGNYVITLKVKQGGCEVTSLKTITIKSKPEINFNENVRSCTNENINFDGILNSGNVTNWQWDFGDGQTAIGQHVIHMYANPGNYSVTLTATDANSCVTILSKTIIINHPQPVSAFNIVNGISHCSGSIVSFKNRSTVPFGRITRLEWFFNYKIAGTNSPDIIENDPQADQIFNFTYPPITSPTTFKVLLKAYSGTQCVNESSQTLTLYPQPQLVFGPAQFCLNRPFHITTASETTGIKGTMTFSGPGVSSTGSFDPQVAGVGDHIITCTFTSDDGCVATKTQTITVSPLPDVQITSTTVPEGIPTKIHPTYEGGILHYHWSPAEGLDDPGSPDPTFTLNDSKTYQLGLTSDDGCTVAKNVEIKVAKEVKIPNAFTPNGDGINDIWKIENASLIPNFRIDIFNRWGQLVYTTKNLENGWDGNFDGKPLGTGTYFYIIKGRSSDKVYSGNITLIR